MRGWPTAVTGAAAPVATVTEGRANNETVQRCFPVPAGCRSETLTATCSDDAWLGTACSSTTVHIGVSHSFPALAAQLGIECGSCSKLGTERNGQVAHRTKPFEAVTTAWHAEGVAGSHREVSHVAEFHA